MDNPFEQQFDPSYFAGQATESGRRRRSSTASENSATSGQYSPELESQFILSMGNTPVVENPPQQPLARPGAITIGGIDGLAPSDQWRTWAKNKNQEDPPRPPNRSTVSDNYTNNISGSRPIAIELPSRRRVNTAPDWNKKPPEHLSARGDVLGGFFPDHGDKQVQFYQPHPFHEDTQRAREDSIVQAVADCNKAPEEREQDAAEVVPMSNPSEPTLLGVLDGVSTQLSAHGSEDAPSTNTIAAYNPLGDHVSPIPTGKYYPTNWENRKRAKGKLIAERPLSSPSATIQAGSEMPKYRLIHPSPPALLDQSHTPKTRLQQYQREMVMHASFAASTLARGKGKATAVATKDSCNASSSSLDLVAMAHIQLGKHRPVSPRLHPLGSPGPVTPMDLESNKADGYIDARPVGPDSDREVEEIANALRAEEERRKREGASSPMGQVKM